MTGNVQYTHIKCQQSTLTLLSIKSSISAIHYAIDIQEYKSTRYSGNESGPVHPRLLVGVSVLGNHFGDTLFQQTTVST